MTTELWGPLTRYAARLHAVIGDGHHVASAMARYGRYGFEAAAVSGFGMADSAPSEGIARIAELRFGHPYAVVAVATDTRPGADGRLVPGPWHGVPVFSGWVSEPEDVPGAEAS